MRFNKPIIIQKLNEDLEVWQDFGTKKYAEINQASGNEYVNAGTNISSKTLKFKIRFSKEIDDLQFNTELYRIIYKNKCFDIKNVDNFKQENNEVTIFAEYNGQSYFQTNNNLYDSKKAFVELSNVVFKTSLNVGETYTFSINEKYGGALIRSFDINNKPLDNIFTDLSVKKIIYTVPLNAKISRVIFNTGLDKPNIADIDFSQISLYKGKEY